MQDTSEELQAKSEPASVYAAMAALTSRIFGDQLQLRAAGIEVRGWSPNHATGAVEMRVASDPNAAQAYLDETYGPGRVIVARADRPPGASIMEPYSGH